MVAFLQQVRARRLAGEVRGQVSPLEMIETLRPLLVRAGHETRIAGRVQTGGGGCARAAATKA